jgi:hypothetical protein
LCTPDLVVGSLSASLGSWDGMIVSGARSSACLFQHGIKGKTENVAQVYAAQNHSCSPPSVFFSDSLSRSIQETVAGAEVYSPVASMGGTHGGDEA